MFTVSMLICVPNDLGSFTFRSSRIESMSNSLNVVGKNVGDEGFEVVFRVVG